MDALERNAVGRRVSCSSQSISPGPIRFVSHPAPVHRAKHNRLTETEQDDTQGLERIIYSPDRLNPPAAQGMTQGRRDVAGECGEVKHRYMRLLQPFLPDRSKFETRNTKSETNPEGKIQMTQINHRFMSRISEKRRSRINVA
jgi:hypothetical protein